MHLCLTNAKNIVDRDYCWFRKFTPWCWVERPVPKADELPPVLDIAPKIEAHNLIWLNWQVRMRTGLLHLVFCGGCLHRFKIWGETLMSIWLLDDTFLPRLGIVSCRVFFLGSRLVKRYKAWWGGWICKIVFPLATWGANKELAATARNVWRSFAFIDIGAERWASEFLSRAAWFHCFIVF